MTRSRPPKPDTRYPLPLLRPYQREVLRAILAAVRAGDGRTLSVQIARQGGKNELSAQTELLLLLTAGAGDLIKVAPSLRPQGLISLNRLWARLRDAGLAPPAVRTGNAIALGDNRLLLLSAAPSAGVVGHTAGALMEVDEAQDVDPERFHRAFRPMGASRGTAAVFYGTPWTETSLLEEMKQRHLELERQDGIRRHFEYDWQTVAAANPSYARFAAAERDRLGEQHPAWRTQYCLETVPGAGLLFTPQQRALLQGTHPHFHTRSRELEHGTIVAGLDVAAEAFAPGGDQDETVLTILHVLWPHPRPLSSEAGEGRTSPLLPPSEGETASWERGLLPLPLGEGRGEGVLPLPPREGRGEGARPGSWASSTQPEQDDATPPDSSARSSPLGRRQPEGLAVSPKISSSPGWGGDGRRQPGGLGASPNISYSPGWGGDGRGQPGGLAVSPKISSSPGWGGDGRRQPGGLGVSPNISYSPGWGGDENEGLPELRIVEQLAWRGASHDALLAELTPLLARVWRPEAIAIDATGVGEGLAAALESRLTALRGGRTRVLRERISEQVKSRLGFGLLAAAGGRLRCYAPDGSPEYREFWTQVANARATYKPNRLMSFGVDPARGHDDYLMSLALAVEAAGTAQPRIARGRRAETENE